MYPRTLSRAPSRTLLAWLASPMLAGRLDSSSGKTKAATDPAKGPAADASRLSGYRVNLSGNCLTRPAASASASMSMCS